MLAYANIINAVKYFILMFSKYLIKLGLEQILRIYRAYELHLTQRIHELKKNNKQIFRVYHKNYLIIIVMTKMKTKLTEIPGIIVKLNWV
jgi:hypothetical protein